jgi:hypothetical protein
MWSIAGYLVIWCESPGSLVARGGRSVPKLPLGIGLEQGISDVRPVTATSEEFGNQLVER